MKLVDLSGLEPPRYYDFPPAPQAGAYCQFRHRSIEIDEGFGTRTQSCVYLRWCFPHLYVRTTGIGCPDRVICPLSWRTKMLPCLLLAGSSAFVTAKRTAIHHASPVPSLINGRGRRSRTFAFSSQNWRAAVIPHPDMKGLSQATCLRHTLMMLPSRHDWESDPFVWGIEHPLHIFVRPFFGAN